MCTLYQFMHYQGTHDLSVDRAMLNYRNVAKCIHAINPSWCYSTTEQNPEESSRLTVGVKMPCQKASKFAYQLHKELHDTNKLQPHSVDRSETPLPPTAWSLGHTAPYSQRSWSLFLLCNTRWLYIFQCLLKIIF